MAVVIVKKKKKKSVLTPEQIDINRVAFRKWYDAHKEEYNMKRMERYYTDDMFRKKAIMHATNSQLRKKLVGGGSLHTVSWCNMTVVVYKLGYVCKFLGIEAHRFRYAEKEGLIPKCSFGTFQRCYTKKQMHLLWEFFSAVFSYEEVGGKMLAHTKKIMGAYIHKHWEEEFKNGKESNKEKGTTGSNDHQESP